MAAAERLAGTQVQKNGKTSKLVIMMFACGSPCYVFNGKEEKLLNDRGWLVKIGI
jgi:hypothetical protein